MSVMMTLMNLKPLRDAIFVQLDDSEKSEGAIILADTTRTEPYANVIAVGPGVPLADGGTITPAVVVGDKVLLLGAEIGKEFRFQGKKYQAISESMIIGVVVPEMTGQVQ